MGHARARTKNPGPSAYEANRRALLDAALTVFDERGPGAPLSAVAKAAHVSQAVLYRHFPNRAALADAVSDERITEMTHLAQGDDDGSFARVWRRLVEVTIAEPVMIEIAVQARHEPGQGQESRLHDLLVRTLALAQRAGRMPHHLTADDVQLAALMIFGAVVTARTPQRATRAHAALALMPACLAEAFRDGAAPGTAAPNTTTPNATTPNGRPESR